MFSRKKNQHKSSYQPPGWGALLGTLLALILAIAAFWGTTQFISNRIQYLDSDLQREFIIPDVPDED